MSSKGTGVKHSGKSFKSQRRDHIKHSSKLHGTKHHGEPAKGGAGGKGTWGRPGDELGAPAGPLDENDPIYDPMEDDVDYFIPPEPSQKKFAESIEDLAKFKDAVKTATREWLNSNDTREFKRIIQELDYPIFHQDIPAVILKTSLEKLEDEAIRHRVVSLLHSLFDSALITQPQLTSALRKLYNRLDELRIDVPHASTLLEKVMESLTKRGLMEQKDADALKESVRLLEDQAAVSQIKEKIGQIISDYMSSEDVLEARQAVLELKAPHLHFELVKKLISTALDRGNRERELASCLLGALVDGVMTEDDVGKAFTILLERVEDTYLDVPDILRLLSIFLARAVADEALPPSFLVRVDLQPGDMGFQVVARAQELLKQPKARLRLAKAWGVRTKASQLTDEDEEEEKQEALAEPAAAAPAPAKKPQEKKTKGDAWSDLPSPGGKPKPKPAAPSSSAPSAAASKPKTQQKPQQQQRRGSASSKATAALLGLESDDEEEGAGAGQQQSTEGMSKSKKRRLRRKRALQAKKAAEAAAAAGNGAPAS